MDIEQTLKTIKLEFEEAIKTATFNGREYANGNKAKNALICSKRIINHIHEFVKNEFLNNGVNKKKIYPSLSMTKPEIKIKGFLKSKDQDISIIPDPFLVAKTKDDYSEVEKILTVNIRSQLSSLSKNVDTLYERTFAEALNLHLKYPKQCLGEVYLIPAYEYDDEAMKRNKIVFINNHSKIEDYIKLFQAINGRESFEKDEYKYERACLLIVDFKTETPKLYSNIDELKKDNLIPTTSSVNFENLAIDNFVKQLIEIYSERFDENLLY